MYKRVRFKLHRNISLHHDSTRPFKVVFERIGCAVGRVCECGGHVHKYTTLSEIKKPPLKRGSLSLITTTNLTHFAFFLFTLCHNCSF